MNADNERNLDEAKRLHKIHCDGCSEYRYHGKGRDRIDFETAVTVVDEHVGSTPTASTNKDVDDTEQTIAM